MFELAAGRVFHERAMKTIGSGRTDAGVHATGQVVNFIAPDSFPVDCIPVALNSILPIDVRVRDAQVAADDFHARYSAKSRKYVYVVLNRAVPSALMARYAWYLHGPLDLRAMRIAAQELIGTHDFASFGMPDKPGRSTMRRIFDIRIGRRNGAVILVVKGNAFLRGMVRAIVGALVDVGRGRRGPAEMLDILDAHDRQAVRVIAPPRGLYLTRVDY